MVTQLGRAHAGRDIFAVKWKTSLRSMVEHLYRYLDRKAKTFRLCNASALVANVTAFHDCTAHSLCPESVPPDVDALWTNSLVRDRYSMLSSVKAIPLPWYAMLR